MSKVNNILYVEDEVDIQTIAKIALEDIGGFNVKICSSGQEAIELIESFNPDLILLDVMMPGIDGPETLKRLKKLNLLGNSSIIFMTAKVQIQEIEYYKSLGALDVISKPFDPITLADKINEIMDNQ